MKNDELLRALGRVAREQRQAEPRALAARAEGAPPPEPAADGRDQALDQLLAPLPTAARDRLVGVALDRLEGSAAPSHAPAAPPAAWPARPDAEPRRRGFRHIALRRLVLWVLPPIAVAASLAVLVVPRDGDRGVSLPTYAIEVQGGAAETRGAEGEGGGRAPLLLFAGAPLVVTLRPATPTAQVIEARAFWRRGAAAHPWNAASVELASSGAVRLVGAAEAPFGAGAGELVVLVAPKGGLPSASEAAVEPAPAVRRAIQPVLWR